jgi:D-lactate dehydrogenase
MDIVVYNVKDYEKKFFNLAGKKHNLCFVPEALSLETVHKVKGYEGVCCFVTDCLNSAIITKLAEYGIKIIALRSAGFDHVDLEAAKTSGITVVRVPKYSPEAIAEFALALILILNRNILKSYLHGLESNFSLNGLMGFNLHKKTVGIIGTGNIGTAFARIMHGFGCSLLAVDPVPNDACRNLNVDYVTLDKLLSESDIISLHCPLNSETKYIINEESLTKVRKNAILINTGRGALCDTRALIKALESGKIGSVGLDVYEKEQGIFFKDHHGETIQDELFLKLQSLDNVIITPHQAFLTHEAIENIVKTTMDNISSFEKGKTVNQIS